MAAPKCSYCRADLVHGAKLVPDCGETICLKCYDRAKASLDRRGKFECKSCHESHSMPRKGLPDNQLVKEMIQKKPQVEWEAQIRRLVQGVQEKLKNVEDLDSERNINAHFDTLIAELKSTLHESIAHLNSLASELQHRINGHRDSLLNATRESREQVKSMKRDVDSFSKDCANRELKLMNEDEMEAIHQRADSLTTKLNELEWSSRRDRFGPKALGFRRNKLFCQTNDHLGELYNEHRSDNGWKFQDKLISVIGRKYNLNSVNQLVFLPNANMASCSWDNVVKIWSPEGRALYELVAHTDFIFSVALLPDGSLASGSYDGSIKIWSPEERKLVKTLSLAGPVFSLLVLRNGLLASGSHDDYIRLWNPSLTKSHLQIKFKGHGIKWWRLHIGQMSTGHLVTCSRDYEGLKEAVVKTWNPKTGSVVDSYPTRSKNAQAILVLFNDHVAVGFRDGEIKIIDFELQRMAKFKAHKGGVYSLTQLSNGCLVSGGSRYDPSIKIWHPEGGELKHTIQSGHENFISTLSLSRAGTKLASGSNDKEIRLWSLELA